MKCSVWSMRGVGFLHLIALVISIIGTGWQISSVRQGIANSPVLPVALTLMLILRLPNQFCVALNESNGWYSVAGTIASVIGYLILAYYSYTSSESS